MVEHVVVSHPVSLRASLVTVSGRMIMHHGFENHEHYCNMFNCSRMCLASQLL